MKRFLQLLLIATSIVGLASGANDMEWAIIAPTGGQLDHAGGASVMTSTVAVDVDWILSLDTPLNTGELRLCSGPCALSFTTGARTGGDGTSTWVFADGGAFTISGAINLDGIPGDDAVGLLMTGTLANSVVISSGASTDPRAFQSDFILAAIHPAIAAFYGAPVAFYDGIIGLQFYIGTAGAGGAFSTLGGGVGPIQDGNISFASAVVIPEPASLILFGSAASLLGLGILRRRKARA